MRPTHLILVGRPFNDVQAALEKTTLRGWTLLPSVGTWTPPSAHSDVPGAPRETEEGTVVLYDGVLAPSYVADILADRLGETSVAYIPEAMPAIRFT